MVEGPLTVKPYPPTSPDVQPTIFDEAAGGVIFGIKVFNGLPHILCLNAGLSSFVCSTTKISQMFVKILKKLVPEASGSSFVKFPHSLILFPLLVAVLIFWCTMSCFFYDISSSYWQHTLPIFFTATLSDRFWILVRITDVFDLLT